MDETRFDVLARAVVNGGTRRTIVRLLAGCVLSTAATSLELGADAARKARREHAQARRRQSGNRREGDVQSERKHKRQGRHKKKPRPPQSTVCDNGRPRCSDGSCSQAGVCCPGSKRCSDGFCVKEVNCCDDEKICDDGSCASQDVCCPGERECADGGCAKPGNCCAGEQKCADGSCVANDACCFDGPAPDCRGACQLYVCEGGQEVCKPRLDGLLCQTSTGREGTCCKGECLRGEIECPKYPWRKFNPATCLCECKTGTDAGGMTCCPAGYPYVGGVGTCQDGHGGIVCVIGWSECACPVGSPLEVCCCAPSTI